MNIKAIYTDSKGEITRGVRAYRDIADIIENFRISTSITGGAGKCEMSIIGDGADFNFGSELRIIAGDDLIFVGYLFSVSMNDTERFSATFYDQTRYLRNQDCLIYKQITASELFTRICNEAGVKTGTIDASQYKLPPTVSEGRAYWDMLSEAINLTAAYDKKMYIIRDNAGALEFRDIENLRTDFVIDDEGIAMGFDYTIGIDKASYNQVKLGYPGGSSYDFGIANNSELVNEWGLLQYYQLFKQKIGKSELEKRCEQQLALVSRPTRELRLECMGDWRISAGSGVGVDISSVMAFRGMHNFYVTSCDHEVSNDLHKMTLTLAIDNFGE